MRIDSTIVVLCELIAFMSWLVNHKRIEGTRYKLFIVYLGVITIIELLNLIYGTAPLWTNILVLYVNIPLQFFFLIYFLIYKPKSKQAIICIIFICIYSFVFLMEPFHYMILPVNFASMSYGVGNLLLIAAIIIALINIFKHNDPLTYNQTALFWILIGLIIFYIGSFPYQNFRDFFWSKKSYHKTAYFLHYLSQAFNCIMYLLFAYAVKWKIK